MSYCINAQKTVVLYNDVSGTRSRYEVNQGNIQVSCEDLPRTGRFIFTVNDGGYNPNCTPQGAITLYTNTFIADSYTVNPGVATNPIVANCSFTRLTFFIGDTQVATQNFPIAYLINSANNPNYSPGGKVLKIRNSQGNLLFQAQVKDCNFNVACGEDCPAGHIKCNCRHYPGYCCIPCGEIKNGIASITSTLKGINNG